MLYIGAVLKLRISKLIDKRQRKKIVFESIYILVELKKKRISQEVLNQSNPNIQGTNCLNNLHINFGRDI